MTAGVLSPVAIGERTAKNRVAVSAHSSGLMCADGNSDKLHAYVEHRAWGGVGLFVLGETLVHDGAEVAGEAWGLAVSGPGIEQTYARLAAAARANDMLLLDQLSHLGGQVWATRGAIAFAPSAVAHPISGVVPAPMDEEQLDRIAGAYVEAAQRAVAGDLDGVEIKCDQGKLLHQFLSSHYNRRNDACGGDANGRSAFPLRILRAIRAAVPPKFILGVRLSLQGYDGLPEAIATTAAFLENAPIDYVSVSSDTNSTYTGYVRGHGGEDTPRPSLDDAVRTVRAATRLPLMVAGKVGTLKEADALIASGRADLVAMTRAHIADPAIVRKHRAGHTARTRPCIACNQSCVGNTWEGREVRCIHNVSAGREVDLSDRDVGRAEQPARVAVIGGGPAGLEATRIAGMRGHRVHLFEAEDRLGGQLLWARCRPGSSRLGEVIEHLEGEVRRIPNVTIHLGAAISEADGSKLGNPDVIFVATGSKSPPPQMRHGTHLLAAEQALSGEWLKAGDKALVVDEDWLQNGLGIALALARAGVAPEIITTREALGTGLNVVTLVSQLAELRAGGVAMFPLTAFIGISEDGITRTLDLCTGRQEDRGLYAGVVLVQNRQPAPVRLSATEAPRIHRIGDCVFPRGVEFAMLDGNRYARRI